MKQPGIIRRSLSLAIAGWGAVLAAHAVTTADFSRYQVILDRNPFGEVAPIVPAGAAAAAGGAAAIESFSKDYEMKGIIDDGEKIRVCVLDKKANKHIYLEIGQEVGGMQLVSVNYDNEEAVLKMGGETTMIKLHPDKDKNKNAIPVVAGTPGVPEFGIPRKNLAVEETVQPFGATDQVARKPFFMDMKRRSGSPFRRLGTNAAFQSKSLESFFKPNTNITTPFVSPFRPQASTTLKPGGMPGAAAQENTGQTFPFAPVQPSDQADGAAAAAQPVAMDPQMPTIPDQGFPQIPIQPATEPVVYDDAYESEE